MDPRKTTLMPFSAWGKGASRKVRVGLRRSLFAGGSLLVLCSCGTSEPEYVSETHLFPAAAQKKPTARTRSVSPEKIKFHVVRKQMAYSQAVPQTEDVQRQFILVFHNGSNEEVAEVGLRFRIMEEDKTVRTIDVPPLTQFENTVLGHKSGAIPESNVIAGTMKTVTYPSALWSTRYHDRWEVASVKVFDGPQDLHEANHLYAWFKKTKDDEVIAEFKRDPSLLKVRSKGGVSVLGIAAAASSPAVFRYLLSQGQKLDAQDNKRRSLMHLAACNSNPEMVALVKDLGAPVDSRDIKGETPLMTAISEGMIDTAGRLLKLGADPNAVDGLKNPPAFFAFYYGMIDAIPMLKAAGANPHYMIPRGGWMHSAATSDYATPAWFDLLKSYGLSPNDADPSSDYTPIMAAARANSPVAIRWLVTHGAKIDAKSKTGRTAFDFSRQGNTLKTDQIFRQQVLEAQGLLSR